MDRRRALLAASAAIGGSTPGTTFKILNKLNGQLIGGPTWMDEFTHSYEFNKPHMSSIILPINCIFPGYPALMMGEHNKIYFRPSNSGALLENNIMFGEFRLYINRDSDSQTSLNIISESNMKPSLTPLNFMYIVTDEEGNYDIDYFSVQSGYID